MTPAPEGGYVAFNPETGATRQGETVEEALNNLREATELYVEEFPLSFSGRPLLTAFQLVPKLPLLLHERPESRSRGKRNGEMDMMGHEEKLKDLDGMWSLGGTKQREECGVCVEDGSLAVVSVNT